MKETFYFPHDYNASEDEKILKLMSSQGWEGYGLYWGLIEKLAASSGARLKLSDLEFIAFGMRTQCERIQNLVNNFDLFEVKDGWFWSKRLVSFFQDKEKKSIKAKESAKVRWSITAGESQSECERNANASKNDAIKERKGKERKEKKRKLDKIFDEKSRSFILANLLFELIRKNNEKAKVPDFQSWADDIDKLQRIDGNTFDEIELIIHWSQQDEFWLQNILSASKLREQFPALWLKAKSKITGAIKKQQEAESKTAFVS